MRFRDWWNGEDESAQTSEHRPLDPAYVEALEACMVSTQALLLMGNCPVNEDSLPPVVPVTVLSVHESGTAWCCTRDNPHVHVKAPLSALILEGAIT